MKLRVAIFTDTYFPEINGVARTVKRLAEKLEDEGIANRIFTVQSQGGAHEGSGEKRFPGVSFWGDPQLTLSIPSKREVRTELVRWKPTIVHVATPFGVGMAGLRSAQALRIPLVTSYHTKLADYARFYGLGTIAEIGWKFLRWFHNSGKRTYCPTQAVCDELGTRGFRNLAVWGRGVDSYRFNPRWRSRELRAELGATDRTVVVTYVGRLAREKGLDDACAAMKRAASENSNLRFVFAGDGPYLEQCKRAAPQDAIFLGPLTGDRLSKVYASSDLFIFPSVTDTFGNVLLEAMASGVPIIAADSAPTREITQRSGAWIVAPGATDQMAAAINVFSHSPEERSYRANLGLMSARRRSWDTIFSDLISSYEEVAAQ